MIRDRVMAVPTWTQGEVISGPTSASACRRCGRNWSEGRPMTVILGVSLVMAALVLLLWRVLLRVSLVLVLVALCVPVAALALAVLTAASHF